MIPAAFQRGKLDLGNDRTDEQIESTTTHLQYITCAQAFSLSQNNSNILDGIRHKTLQSGVHMLNHNKQHTSVQTHKSFCMAQGLLS